MANSFETEWEKPELDTLSSLAQHLVYRLPECDDNFIRLTLREVYRDFCRRSCCLRVRRPFDYEPSGEYFVPSIFGGRVLQVTEVCDGNHRLREGRDYTANANRVLVRRPLHHAPPPPPPEGAKPPHCPLTIAWIEVPTLSSEKIPKWLIEKHGDAICAGVLSRLYSMSNRKWSDPNMAVIESNRYEAAVNEECQCLYAVGESGNLGNLFDTSDLI